MAERPTPDAVFKRLVEQEADDLLRRTNAFAALLVNPAFHDRYRSCVGSAPRPAKRSRRDRQALAERTGTELLDGIGSTEMLHIFLSNRPGDVRPGTTGKPVPGYELRLVDDQGNA
jgi:benzoate-CoA ligase